METFVVRIFVPEDAVADRLCGVVEHSGAEFAQAFRSAEDLVQIVLCELERERVSLDPTQRSAKEEQ